MSFTFIRQASKKGRISSIDLSKGDKQYLARKGIRGREFDKMPEVGQREWVAECKEGAYSKNDKDYKTQDAIFKY
jgi:hypothetical protein